MPSAISADAVAALNPVDLSSPVVYDPGTGVITANGATVQTKDIVVAAKLEQGDYVLVTFSQDENSNASNPYANPFHLAAFRAPALPQEILSTHLISSAASEVIDPSTTVSVIISTKSGTGLSERFHDAVIKPLLGIFNVKYLPIVTYDANCISFSTLPQRNPKDPSTPSKLCLIILSGDGGIADILNYLKLSPAQPLPTIAMIPLGTANALFHSLHKPHYTSSSTSTFSSCSPLTLALRALFHGRTAPLPTFEAIFPPGSRRMRDNTILELIDQLTGAVVASYGFHAQLVWESDKAENRIYGAERFGIVAAKLLFEPHDYWADVSTTLSGDLKLHPEDGFNYVVATLVSNLEKTFTISPASKPLDGVLRLVAFTGMGGEGVKEVMKAAYACGAHVAMEGVRYEEVGEELRVVSWEPDARWRKVCVDGTIVELPRGQAMIVKKSEKVKAKVLVLDPY